MSEEQEARLEYERIASRIANILRANAEVNGVTEGKIYTVGHRADSNERNVILRARDDT